MARLNVGSDPYSPIPQAESPDTAIPNVQVPAQPAAFGVGIAESLRGLGQQGEQIGNELFRTATELQSMKNETDVNDAATQFMIKGGEAADNFQLVQGKDAHDQLTKHLQDVNNMRLSARGALGNPMAQRMFDQQTLSAFRQYTVRSAAHAASQMNQYTKDSNKAMVALAGSDIRKNAFQMSEEQLWGRIAETHQYVQQQFRGSAPEVVRNEIAKSDQDLLRVFIEAKGDDDPITGQRLLDKYRNKLDSDVYHKLSAGIENQTAQIAGRSAAENTLAGHAPGATQGDKDAASAAVNATSQVARGFTRFEANNGRDSHIMPGEDPRSLYVTADDVDDAAGRLEGIARSRGIPMEIEKGDGRVKITLPQDYDISTTPQELPRPREENVGLARAYVERMYPNIAKAGDVAEIKVNGLHAKQQADAAQAVKDNKNAIWQVWKDNPPKSEDELRERLKLTFGSTKPIDDLPAKEKQTFLDAIGRQDAHTLDPATWEHYNGMTAEELINTNPEEIMTNSKLTHGAKIRLLDKQTAFLKDPSLGQHVSVNIGMRLIESSLPEYITGDKETYRKFRSRYEDRLMYELGQTGEKHVPLERMKEIGIELSREITQQGGKSFLDRLFGTDQREFEMEPDAQQLAAAKADPIWAKNEYPPTDEEAASWWRVREWDRKYGKKTKGTGFFTGDEGIGEGSGLAEEPEKPAETPAAAPTTAAPTPAPATTGTQLGTYTGGTAGMTEEQLEAARKASEAQAAAVRAKITSARQATGRVIGPESVAERAAQRAAEAKKIDEWHQKTDEAIRQRDLGKINAQLQGIQDQAARLRAGSYARPAQLDQLLLHLARQRHQLEEAKKGL